jgi:hypothetical protein
MPVHWNIDRIRSGILRYSPKLDWLAARYLVYGYSSINIAGTKMTGPTQLVNLESNANWLASNTARMNFMDLTPDTRI